MEAASVQDLQPRAVVPIPSRAPGADGHLAIDAHPAPPASSTLPLIDGRSSRKSTQRERDSYRSDFGEELCGNASEQCCTACGQCAAAAGYILEAAVKFVFACCTCFSAVWKFVSKLWRLGPIAAREQLEELQRVTYHRLEEAKRLSSNVWDVTRLGCRASAELFIDAINFLLCRLPPPPALTDEERAIATAERQIPHERRLLAMGVAASAILLMIFEWLHTGRELAMWTPIGGVAGLVGTAIGILYAAIATPSATGASLCDRLGRLPIERADIVPTAVSIAASSSLSALLAGLVAWSVHKYPTEARTRGMWVVEGGLVLTFAGRAVYKTWRGCGWGGGDNLRLVAGGAGGCCDGCRWWPSLL